ncbi:hypothetical protein JCM10213_006770 [Rhodosporidiobolus nylandii]
MATPSAAFPFSPTPQTPAFPSDVTSTPPQHYPQSAEPRQNKRTSTASQQGGRSDYSAYPSPPQPGSSSQRRQPAYDPSLVIPPFNPNKRRSAGPTPAGHSGTSSSSSTPAASSRRGSTQGQQGGFDASTLLPSPPLPAQYQPTHAHAHAHGQRPVSAAIVPQIPAFNPAQYQHHHQQQQHYAPAPPGPGGSVSSRSRQSVGYLPTNSLAGQGPYPHLYTPHPMPRQKIYFGPYILLQTLGEGEFGKVKLGVHSERWGEDVAIKLIKRGNVDTAQRGEKVRREIEVLKMVRHPNIVRLYDVIETEKYIGIVLEYASGGELFDHILAHRYLKERDASRLFAQLISGVSYLHSKGVVHRDLKLENLLLDRNRNVIITDFGFANRFNDAHVDLMATSCGSPCYAAPELVVQDGRYVGTAVDVWSCGVILYAMLAGYLPYDDDPANPEGDNINLLYKYILNTPLTFPDWITDEPRHLLLTMLVPDPLKRCTIKDVTRHSWLRKYAHAFEKTVDELEYQAQEMEAHKRQALEIQRQWLIQQQHQQQLAAQGLLAPSMTRSQTATSQMGMAGPPSAAARHRSAMVTSASTAAASAPLAQHGFEHYQPVAQPQTPTTVQEEATISPRTRTTSTASTSARRPVPGAAANPNRRSGGGAYVVSASPPTTSTEFVAAEAGPFSFETARASPSPVLASAAMIPSLSAPAAASSPTAGEDHIMAERPSASRQNSTSRPSPGPSDAADDRRRKASHRATVQVEYDPSASNRRSRREPPPPSPLAASGPVQGLAIHAEEPVEEASPMPPAPAPASLTLDIPHATEGRESTSPSPVPSVGGVSISTTTETMPGEDVVMESVEEEEETQVLPPPVEEQQPVVEKEEVKPVELDVEQVEQPQEQEQAVAEPAAEEARPAGPPPILAPIARPSTPPGIPFPTPPALDGAAVPTSPTHLNGTPRKRKSSRSPVSSVTEPEPLPVLPLPPAADAEVPPRPKLSAASQSSAATEARAPSVASSTATSRHRHTPSAGRMSIRQLLGGSAPAGDRPPSSASQQSGAATPLDEVTNRRKTTRRQKALSLQPFRNSVSSKLPKQARQKVDAQTAASRGRSNTAVQPEQPPPQTAAPPLPTARPAPQPSWVRPNAQSNASRSSKRLSQDLEANWSGAGAPTPSGKAKAVMDWFRRKSTKGDGLAPPIPTDFDDRRYGSRPPSSLAGEPPASSNTSMRDGAITPTAPAPAASAPPVPASSERPAHPERAPSLVVSPAIPQVESQPSSRTPSGAHSSQISTSAAATTVNPNPAVMPAFTPSRLRYHQGAIDRKALTYRVPTEVINEVKQALWDMGVDMALEGEYKLKCVRKSKKKTDALRTSISGASTGGVASAAAASGPLDRRNTLTASPTLPQSPSMGFRSIFNRSSRSPAMAASPTFGTLPPSTPTTPNHGHDVDPLSSPMTTSVSQFSMLTLGSPNAGQPQRSQPLPAYGGEKSADAGDEVRFVVEITRVKNLADMYCVDTKRLKGQPWSYKHVYDQLLDRLQLGEV